MLKKFEYGLGLNKYAQREESVTVLYHSQKQRKLYLSTYRQIDLLADDIDEDWVTSFITELEEFYKSENDLVTIEKETDTRYTIYRPEDYARTASPAFKINKNSISFLGSQGAEWERNSEMPLLYGWELICRMGMLFDKQVRVTFMEE